MVEQVKSWMKENSALVYFLIAQMIAIGAAGASALAYFTRLETRVSIMETRGAEYSVARMSRMEEKITVLEQQIKQNQESIRLYRDQYFKDRNNK
jgi:hypothetical protein